MLLRSSDKSCGRRAATSDRSSTAHIFKSNCITYKMAVINLSGGFEASAWAGDALSLVLLLGSSFDMLATNNLARFADRSQCNMISTDAKHLRAHPIRSLGQCALGSTSQHELAV